MTFLGWEFAVAAAALALVASVGWELAISWKANAKQAQGELKAAMDWVGTLQAQLSALHEQHRQEQENAKQRNSERVRKAWKTRRAA